MALYPPSIKSNIPSFYLNETTYKIEIPFEDNKTISSRDYDGYVLQIKSLNTDEILATSTLTFNSENKNNILIFTIPSNDYAFEPGQYYKCQIAYKNGEDIGIFSGVQTIKCTTKPVVEIINNNSIIQGKYTNVDASEIVQQYRFRLYKNNILLNDTGWRLHNSISDIINDTGLVSTDDYEINYNIVNNECNIIYDVITINNLQLNSSEILNEELLVPLNINLNLLTELNYENGYVDLSLVSTEDSLTGLYNILRSDEDDDFNNWNIIYNFKLNQENPNKKIFKDFTIQQGKKYKYALQQYNKYNVKSTYIIAKTNEYKAIENDNNYRIETPVEDGRLVRADYITADFEDMFLFDGERSLKIRFNPKVSSFKTTVLETKIDTLSNQYPIFFKNGYTNYKEFQLSGLIACEMDEQELFASHDILDKNLSGKNFLFERNFKLEVLNWLNNGKPKLFRSPAEGNYIVRLMNVSLTPIDQLGRMIHSFNCAAYEVAELTHNNLLQYSIFNYNNKLNLDDVGKKLMHYESTTAKELQSNPIEDDLAIYYLKIDGAMPGDKIIIQQKNSDEKQNIVIGATGSYEIELDTIPIIYVGVEESNNVINNFTITYGYRVISTNIDDFNYIGKIEKRYVAAEQVETGEPLGSLLNSKYTKILDKLWHIRVETKPKNEQFNYYINYGDTEIECIPGRVYEYDTDDWENVESISFGNGLIPIVSYNYIQKIYFDANGNELTDETDIEKFLSQERTEKNDE